MVVEKRGKVAGFIVLFLLALIGWYVLWVQNPNILLRARWKYDQAKGLDLSSGPCLGEIAPGWVLDIAHLPRQPIDDNLENQCQNFQHFVEMSPRGEIIHVE